MVSKTIVAGSIPARTSKLISSMTVEYVVGSFLHECDIVSHVIPEILVDLPINNEVMSQRPDIKSRRQKKTEWSTNRKSKYV